MTSHTKAAVPSVAPAPRSLKAERARTPKRGAADENLTSLIEELATMTPEERLLWDDDVLRTIEELRHGFSRKDEQ